MNFAAPTPRTGFVRSAKQLLATVATGTLMRTATGEVTVSSIKRTTSVGPQLRGTGMGRTGRHIR